MSRPLHLTAPKVLYVRTNPSVENLSVRKAEAAHCVKRFTLSDEVLRKFRGVTKKSPGRKRSFTQAAEKFIVKMLLNRPNVAFLSTVIMIVKYFSSCCWTWTWTSLTVPFSDKGPGDKFLRSFKKMHKHQRHCRRPLHQKGQRFRAVNSEFLTTHFASIEKLVKEHNIDAVRTWNLDETGCSPGRDVVSSKSTHLYPKIKASGDVQVPEFLRASLATVMAVINGHGSKGPPLFVFKGASMPYR